MNIVETIVEHKREEVAKRKRDVKVSTLSESELFQRETLSLRASLTQCDNFPIIAEIKRCSPAAGILRYALVVPDIARDFEIHGAAAISVLTDETFFSGSLDDLRGTRRAVSLPILRKDFIIDEYQIFEAKAHGADAILLIAAILEESQLSEYRTAAQELGLEALIELYNEKELDILDFDSMKLVGINNRDLRTFQVDLQRSLTLAQLVPRDITIVSESGINSIEDVKRLRAGGFRAALIGEHLMKAVDPGKALEDLLHEISA